MVGIRVKILSYAYFYLAAAALIGRLFKVISSREVLNHPQAVQGREQHRAQGHRLPAAAGQAHPADRRHLRQQLWLLQNGRHGRAKPAQREKQRFLAAGGVAREFILFEGDLHLVQRVGY